MIDRLKAGRRDFMYRIQEGKDREKNILLIPAMLDAHFPLLQYAFYSKNYHPIILENEDNITDMGLRYCLLYTSPVQCREKATIPLIRKKPISIFISLTKTPITVCWIFTSSSGSRKVR